jgi:hypothetical protein
MSMITVDELSGDLEYFGPEETDPVPIEVPVAVAVISVGLASTVEELLRD